MILTVTLNPLVEKKLVYEKIIPGTNHRNGSLSLQAGGKGINVSRQLNNFGIDNLAFTFIGGTSGKLFNDLVHLEKIKFSAVRTKSETRSAVVVTEASGKNLTTFFEPSPEIAKTEASEFLSRLEKMIQNCDMLVLSGSSPHENTDHIFPAAIEIANKLDKVSLCDTYGRHLDACLNAGPTIVHNNIDEIRSSLNTEITDDKSKQGFLGSLYSKNIRQVFITEGSSPFLCSNFDYYYNVIPPLVNTVDATGSGDALTAGILYGWQHSLTFEETTVFAASAGAVNASCSETCMVNINDIENIKKDVVISPVGKKMKIIDVTPQ